MRTSTKRRHLAALALVALIAAACSESSGDETAATDSTTDNTASATTGESSETDGGGTSEVDNSAETYFGDIDVDTTNSEDLTDATADSVVERWAGQPWFAGEIPAEPVAASGDPILIGMINQENETFGSFPELRQAADAAVNWVNTELGGVNGRPLELQSCNANFSPEESRQCALDHVRNEAVAVTLGIDVMSANALPVLEENGVPVLGGIPVNLDEMLSSNAYMWSGGTPGAFVAWSQHAIDAFDAERVAIAYPEFEPIEFSALTYGVDYLEERGVEVDLVKFSLTDTDFTPVMNKAAENDPDAVFFATTNTGCVAAMEAADAVGLEAPVFFTGACASPELLEEAGTFSDGRIFNTESLIGSDPNGWIDRTIYLDAILTHGEPGMSLIGAGTVSFKSIMNIWQLLSGIDEITSESITEAVTATTDQASFMGHPYTCDGEQMPGLPAMCSPQQVLAVSQDAVLSEESDGWIDVAALLQS